VLRKLAIVVAIKTLSTTINFIVVKIVSFFTKVKFLNTTKITFVIEAKLVLFIINIIAINKFLLLLRIDINFCLIKNFIYYIKNNKIQLYIFRNIKSIVMRTTYNDCFYINYY